MLTAADRKLYASLDSAKGRRSSGLFMAQGTKCVLDTLGHFRLQALLATEEWAAEHKTGVPFVAAVKKSDLERITTLKSAPDVIAIYEIPKPEAPANEGLVLALDCVQDPGNLGTIMRVCDWMGVHTILASADTADCWNPKVVQATMGAISRVRVHYFDDLASELKGRGPVFGTFLDGENIYKCDLPDSGVIVMGNEGKGISAEVAATVSRRIRIPSYPEGAETSESLNVAIATAITLSQFRSR